MAEALLSRLSDMGSRSNRGVYHQLRLVIGSLAFTALAALAASDAYAATPAETFVQSGIDRSYAILNDGELSASERRLQFGTLLSSIVDVKRVALFTLGPYARSAPEGDVEKFELAFADFLTAVYQRGLGSYTDPKVTGSTERAADDVIVNVTAATPNRKSAPLQLAFRVRRASNGGLAVTDIQVEGAWLAILERAEFTAYLQQHRADIGALAMALQERTERIRLAQSESEIYRRGR